MTEHLLSINLLVALVGLIFILLTKRNQALIIKTAAAIISGIQVWIGIEMLLNFNPHETALQFAERIHWIDGLRIDYYIGIDSGNLVFLLMTALLIFVSVLISWRQEKRVKEYFTFLMILNLGLTGAFAAMNLFLFVIFLGLAFFAALI
jgi:NADH-quinone oxidoreductase subunit M